jgi:two-component sensor histidine kinase
MLSGTDWIAVVSIVAPLVARWVEQRSVAVEQKKSLALNRIVGMAGREAATIANTLSTMEPAEVRGKLQNDLVDASTGLILKAMGDSAARLNADTAQISGIVSGELAKLTAPRPTIPIVKDPAP